MHIPKTQFVDAAIDSSKSSEAFFLVKKNDGWENKVSSLRSEVITFAQCFQVKQVEVPAFTLADVCKI